MFSFLWGKVLRIILIWCKIYARVVKSGKKWVKHMFMGEFNHTLDAKGRMIMPAKFREALGDAFVVTKGFDNCLAVYDPKNWEVLQEKLAQMPMTSADARNLRRMIVGSATETEADKQGRILLPAPLRLYAGIEKDAVIIGNIDHVEIWSKESWEKTSDIDTDLAAEKLYGAGITL